MSYKMAEDDTLLIRVIDGDKIETKNLQRQGFAVSQIGENKAIAMAKLIGVMFSDSRITVEPVHLYLTPTNIDLITEGSINFVAADNYKTRWIVEQKAITMKDVMVIFGGNETFDGDCHLVHIENGALLTKLYSEKHPEIANPKDKLPTEVGCAEAMDDNPQIILTNMACANAMVTMLFSRLEGIFKRKPWSELSNISSIYFDVITGNQRCQ